MPLSNSARQSFEVANDKIELKRQYAHTDFSYPLLILSAEVSTEVVHQHTLYWSRKQVMSNQTGEYVPTQLIKPRTTSFVREFFTSNFWMSGLAILKYIPRLFSVKQVDGNAFFTEGKHDEFRGRVLRITRANPRQWGTMTVAQMLHHLNLACGGSLGFYDLPDESYFVSRTVFRWILVDWYPEQPVGLRLPKGFKIPHNAAFDFDFEKEQLLKILDAAWHARSAADWQPHPMFGPMTVREWGKLLQIHIDYHLRQFAA